MYFEPVSLLLVLANLGAFYLEQQAGSGLILTYGLWPVESGRFQPSQLMTYSFLHASGVHLVANMFALLMFGAEVEHRIGWLRFLVYSLCCILFAALLQLAVAIVTGTLDRPTIGASGAVFGVLLAYAMLFPDHKLTPIIMPVPIPAWLFVGLYGVLELVLGMLETEDGIAHFAHLGGMMGGWFLMQYWLDKLPPRDHAAGT
jgi:membrane associated rhomboid family serine protease